MSGRKLVVVLLALIASLAGLIVFGPALYHRGPTARATALPPAGPEGVARVEATLELHDNFCEPFEIDPADFGKVLALFRGGTERKGPPAGWSGPGWVRIDYKDGRRFRVQLLRLRPNEPGVYRIDAGDVIGKEMYGPPGEEIIRTIKHCHERVKKSRPG
jgi:hypothetical protein